VQKREALPLPLLNLDPLSPPEQMLEMKPELLPLLPLLEAPRFTEADEPPPEFDFPFVEPEMDKDVKTNRMNQF
jgi:hypothetical protein